MLPEKRGALLKTLFLPSVGEEGEVPATPNAGRRKLSRTSSPMEGTLGKGSPEEMF